MRTDDELLALVDRWAPALTVDPASVRRLDDGWDFDVLLCSATWDGPEPERLRGRVAGHRDWVFRFPRRSPVAAALERELQLLPALAPQLPVAVPRPAVLGLLPGDELARFAGYVAIPGRPLDAELLLGARGGLLVSQLAGALAVLHEQVSRRTPGIRDATGETERQRYADLLARARAGLPVPSAVSEEWGAALADDRMWPDMLSVVHGDLGPPHVLVDPHRAVLTGLIDWTDARLADPALDFADLLGGFGEQAARTVFEAYADARDTPPDDAFLDRARFLESLGPVHTAMFGRDAGLVEYVDAGVRALAARAR